MLQGEQPICWGLCLKVRTVTMFYSKNCFRVRTALLVTAVPYHMGHALGRERRFRVRARLCENSVLG